MKKLVSLFLALCLVLACCAVAFAEPAAETPASPFDATSTVSVTVKGLEPGDTLHLYKIATPSVDEHNQLVVTWTDDAIKTAIEGKADEGNAYAANAPLQAAVAKLIADGKINVSGEGDPKATCANDATSVTVNAAPGYYVAVVKGHAIDEGSDETPDVYQNMLINVIPQADATTGTWKSHTAVEINAKKTTVDLDKKQKEQGGTTWTAETVDGYKVGEYIPFEINTNIPSYPSDAKVATFEISDNPTGLKIVNNNTYPVTVTVGTSAVTAGDNTYTLTVTNDGKLSIAFAKSYILANPGAAVKVNYSAELLANDNEIEVDTTNNKAKIKYNRNPDEETYYEPEITIKQKTYNFTLLKYKEGDTAKNPLVGASFSLWTAAEGGSKIALKRDTTAAGKVVYRPIKDGETADEFIVADDGTATVVGLGDQDYYIQEDIAPANFTRLNGRQKVHPSESTSTAEIDVEIPNTQGTELPSTGGIGTTIFYVLGGLLVVGAAIILVARRKADEK